MAARLVAALLLACAASPARGAAAVAWHRKQVGRVTHASLSALHADVVTQQGVVARLALDSGELGAPGRASAAPSRRVAAPPGRARR